MDLRRLATVAAIALVTVTPLGVGAAQESNPKAEQLVMPLRMTVVFNEYEGTTKISSLPYTMPCKAMSRNAGHDVSQLIMGFRVPYRANKDEIQFQDVGTHLDCWSAPPDEHGAFMVQLGVDRTTVYSPSETSEKAAQWHPGMQPPADPVFGRFTANLRDLLIHDGQTVQAATATDPVSGHVWKVEVTLNVVK